VFVFLKPPSSDSLFLMLRWVDSLIS